MSTVTEQQVEFAIPALRERLDPNPWQPRRIVNEEADIAMQASLRSLGLLQYPIIRDAGQRLQTGAGHRRLRNVFALFDAGEWGQSIKVVLRELTDRQMALLGLAENDVRQDVSPLERIQAWRRMLDEIPDLKQTEIAESSGLAESTVSNGLRLLGLPDAALQKLESGEMPVRTARDLVMLKDHPHVIEHILQFQDSLTPDAVRNNMRNAAHMVGWHHVEEPQIDMDAFDKANPGIVITLPGYTTTYGQQRDPAVYVTDKRLFGKAESAVRKAAKAASGEPEESGPTYMPKQLQDPVIRSEAKRLGVKTNDPAALEAAGTRGQLMRVEKRYSLPDGVHDLRAIWLDNSDCGGCTQGARWLLHEGANMKQPQLVCENKTCFAEHQQRVYQRWLQDFADRAAVRDVGVLELATELQDTLEKGSGLARTALRQATANLLRRGDVLNEGLHDTGWGGTIPHVNAGFYSPDFQSHLPYEISNQCRRRSAAGAEIAELLDVDNTYRIEDALLALPDGDERVPRIAALLLAHTALLGKEWGPRPPVNPEFSPEKPTKEDGKGGARSRRRAKTEATPEPAIAAEPEPAVAAEPKPVPAGACNCGHSPDEHDQEIEDSHCTACQCPVYEEDESTAA